MNRKERAKLGRKRLDNKKKNLTLSVDPQLLEELKKYNVKTSKLFSIAAKIYLRKKRKDR